MRKWLSVVAIVVLCLALVIGIACGGGEEEEAGVTELKFGVGTCLTGGVGATVGLPAKYAFTLACEKIGEFTVGGERYRWKVYVEDSSLSIAGGATSARKLIYERGVDFLMHQTGSDPGFAAAMITEELGIILDIAWGNPYAFGPDLPYTFATCPAPALSEPVFFDWLTKEHPEVKVVATTYQETDVGLATLAAIEACCDYHGLELKGEVIPVGTVEYYPVATRLMTHDIDLVIGGLDLLKPMWDMGYEGLYATGTWMQLVKAAVPWDKAEGYLIYMPHTFGDWLPEVTAIAVEFEDRYGVELTGPAFWAYVIPFVITEAIIQAGTVDDTKKIVETMETGTFDTMIGPIHYGLEELNGIGHLGVWPNPIYQIVGENEYRVLTVYTAEEVEAIALEVWRMAGWE